jgi:hypothetical protein
LVSQESSSQFVQKQFSKALFDRRKIFERHKTENGTVSRVTTWIPKNHTHVIKLLLHPTRIIKIDSIASPFTSLLTLKVPYLPSYTPLHFSRQVLAHFIETNLRNIHDLCSCQYDPNQFPLGLPRLRVNSQLMISHQTSSSSCRIRSGTTGGELIRFWPKPQHICLSRQSNY